MGSATANALIYQDGLRTARPGTRSDHLSTLKNRALPQPDVFKQVAVWPLGGGPQRHRYARTRNAACLACQLRGSECRSAAPDPVKPLQQAFTVRAVCLCVCLSAHVCCWYRWRRYSSVDQRQCCCSRPGEWQRHPHRRWDPRG